MVVNYSYFDIIIVMIIFNNLFEIHFKILVKMTCYFITTITLVIIITIMAIIATMTILIIIFVIITYFTNFTHYYLYSNFNFSCYDLTKTFFCLNLLMIN